MFVISLETVNTFKVLLFRTLGQIKKTQAGYYDLPECSLFQ